MVALPGRRAAGRPAVAADEGRMTLVEHLRELRRRLAISLAAVAVTMAVAWFFYQPVLDALVAPYAMVADDIEARTGSRPIVALSGLVSPFVFQLKVSFVVALVVSSPVWLYQVWAFVTPALYRNERRWTLAFFATAVPLFLGGVATAFYALPKGIAILLGFTPDAAGITNFQALDDYLSFVLRLMVVFGLGYVLPVFEILLNRIGVLPGRTLVHVRPWAVTGIFVFAAVATPTGDPFNMLLVALPMTALHLLAEVVCRTLDRRSRRAEPFAGLDDDTASPLPADAGADEDAT